MNYSMRCLLQQMGLLMHFEVPTNMVPMLDKVGLSSGKLHCAKKNTSSTTRCNLAPHKQLQTIFLFQFNLNLNLI